MTLETIIFSDLNFYKSIPYLFVVFFSTLIAYNLKGVKYETFPHSEIESEKATWVKKNKSLILIVVALSAIFGAFELFFLNKKTIYVLLPLGLLSLGYSTPLKIGKYSFVLREIPLIKTILVALVWTIVVALLPYVESGKIADIDTIRIIGDFIFLLSLAMLFDIKDLDTDEKMKIKTIPMMIGVNGTKTLSVGLIMLRLGYLFFMKINIVQLLGETVVALIAAGLIILHINRKTSEYFYMLWIDGLMILRSFLILLFYLASRNFH